MPIRQPIVCVLGHVDSGKTSLLDELRKTTVQAREAGGMTQHIGASFFPVETLKQLIGPYMGTFKTGIEIPGLLIVDTPGHEAFTNLRRRGGSVADIAILVVDALKGFEAQTFECIEILKARKTPFIVAVNKIDRLPGWKSQRGATFMQSYSAQSSFVREELDNQLYQVMGDFSRLTFKTEIAFALNEHPRIVGPRKYRYHSPLISAEWCAFTNFPWGRGLINFDPAAGHKRHEAGG